MRRKKVLVGSNIIYESATQIVVKGVLGAIGVILTIVVFSHALIALVTSQWR